MERGVRRQVIFQDDFDYQVLMELIREELLKKECILHAYCLMSNHFHLLLETGTIDVWRFMKAIAFKYAMQYNNRYGYKGHVFENRYVSRIIDTDDYFLQVSRYIHLNPVKAKMAVHPEDYTWSSYKKVIGLHDDKICSPDKTLEYFEDGVQGYIDFVEDIACNYTVAADEIKKSMGENELWLPW
jgi:REP element-mobilizing transposase RayT